MSYLAKNYNRKKISFVKGKGSYLYTLSGAKYLDFVQGIAVNCLGHSHPKLFETIYIIRLPAGREEGQMPVYKSQL